MSNKYDHIQKLIDYWSRFEDENKEIDIHSFGKWLIQKKELYKIEDDHKSNQLKIESTSVINQESRQEIILQMSKIARFIELVTKKIFEGLPINNLIEFNFLYTANKSNAYNKKDIISKQMVEYSTGVDILNRLTRLNLIETSKDVIDKRNKKLRITSEGKKVILDAILCMHEVYELAFGNLSAHNIESLSNLLNVLNNGANNWQHKNDIAPNSN